VTRRSRLWLLAGAGLALAAAENVTSTMGLGPGHAAESLLRQSLPSPFDPPHERYVRAATHCPAKASAGSRLAGQLHAAVKSLVETEPVCAALPPQADIQIRANAVYPIELR
jgi:hypothetical protein